VFVGQRVTNIVTTLGCFGRFLPLTLNLEPSIHDTNFVLSNTVAIIQNYDYKQLSIPSLILQLHAV